MEDEVTITQAAALKGVTRPAIHKAIRQGRLPARWQEKAAQAQWSIERPGHISPRGVWMIRRSDLNAWEPTLDPVERGLRSGRARRKKKEQQDGQE